MIRKLSVDRIMAELEARIERHRQQEAHHAQRETFHQQQKERHAAELESTLERYEAFRAATDSVGELVGRPREEPALDESLPTGKWAVLSRLVARIVATKGPLEPFGANEITREIQARWGDRLKRRIDPRSVAAKLRRMALAGRIHQVREGRAFHEALYS